MADSYVGGLHWSVPGPYLVRKRQLWQRASFNCTPCRGRCWDWEFRARGSGYCSFDVERDRPPSLAAHRSGGLAGHYRCSSVLCCVGGKFDFVTAASWDIAWRVEWTP